jgi:hypothetical protein
VAIRVRPMLKGDIGKEIVVFPLKQVSYILNILIILGQRSQSNRFNTQP